MPIICQLPAKTPPGENNTKTPPPAPPALTKSFFSSFIPYAGTLIIIFGALRLYHYYDYFQVNIFNFISFGEILALFIESVQEPVYVFLAITISFTIVRLIRLLLPRPSKKIGDERKKEEEKNEYYDENSKRLFISQTIRHIDPSILSHRQQ